MGGINSSSECRSEENMQNTKRQKDGIYQKQKLGSKRQRGYNGKVNIHVFGIPKGERKWETRAFKVKMA